MSSNSGFERKDDNEWRRNLSMKENTLYGIPPYMPILIENIPDYVQLKDFEFDRVKEVQTVGIVYGNGWQEALIHNCTKDNHISIKLTFACCRHESLQKSGYMPGKKIPCKLFGRLINYEGKPLLEVHHFCKTNDMEGSLKTITMLSELVRQKYHYYACSKNP
ncbi:uncharacterized protein LOC122509008 isoform X1 [Leptopilina heterotoma]|uniref:uncharacterized protein LOC122509008 isoform X1 n=1 Tax=Leptopilina heterotoma TaxID=63436 RepID=UPI001CA87E5D|nr:uncharacterized protein LOC122509008 isoform X1 [Leptopilina heterotoma]